MNVPRSLFQLVRADFLERVRRPAFLVTLGFTLYAAYLFLPSNHASYATLNLAGHRGLYNSAWGGSLVAMMAGTFLGLAGFYLVKDAVERDRHTGVGQILAATPLTAPLYLLGKMLSNFAVLAAMVAVLAAAAGVMQVIRGEDTQVRLLPLLTPFALVTLPVMGLVAALAVCFEVIPALRGGLGNVVYFFLWISALSLPALRGPADARDVVAIRMLVPQMQAACTAVFPDYTAGSGFSMGFNIKAHGGWDMKTFVWEGAHWTPVMLAWRAFWMSVPFALILAIAPLFDRFDAQRATSGGRSRRPARGASTRAPRPPGRMRVSVLGSPGAGPHRVADRALSPLAARAVRFRFGALAVAELRIALKGVTRWWFLVALGIAVASVFVPLAAVRHFLAPFAMIWPMLLWSPLGTRERLHRTDALLFSSPRPIGRLLAAQWLAGWVVALAAVSGAAIRFTLTSDWGGLGALMVGAAFAPALALAFGTWSGSTRLFEVTYLMLWYGGPMSGIPPIDFVGSTQPAAGPGPPVTFLALTAGLMGLAVLGRRRQLRR